MAVPSDEVHNRLYISLSNLSNQNFINILFWRMTGKHSLLYQSKRPRILAHFIKKNWHDISKHWALHFESLVHYFVSQNLWRIGI